MKAHLAVSKRRWADFESELVARNRREVIVPHPLDRLHRRFKTDAVSLVKHGIPHCWLGAIMPYRKSSSDDQDVSGFVLKILVPGNLIELVDGDGGLGSDVGRAFAGLQAPSVVIKQDPAADNSSILDPVWNFPSSAREFRCRW